MDSILYANLKGRNRIIRTQSVKEQFSEKKIVAALVEVSPTNFDDFAKVSQQYNAALSALQNEIEMNASPGVDDVIDAIERQAASNLTFSDFLGIKANLDNFIDPIARNFLDADFDVFLRGNTAHGLPEYEQAERILNRFFTSLSPDQKEHHDAILEYITYLEVVGPKLAHYFGYQLGNELLYRVIPGYHNDPELPISYRNLLRKYFGKIIE